MENLRTNENPKNSNYNAKYSFITKLRGIVKRHNNIRRATMIAMAPFVVLGGSACGDEFTAGRGSGEGGNAGSGGTLDGGSDAGAAGNTNQGGEGGCTPTEDVCDGMANNCNGTVDENCTTTKENPCYKQGVFASMGSTTFLPGSTAYDNQCEENSITFMSEPGNVIYIWIRDFGHVNLISDADYTCYRNCSISLQPPNHDQILNDIAVNAPFTDLADEIPISPLETQFVNPDTCTRYIFLCNRT
jgi:hypothetical protein